MLFRIFVIYSSLILSLSLFTSLVYAAPSSTNAFNMYIPRVLVNNTFEGVKETGTNDYLYEGVMNDNDEIRYGWNTVAISLGYKESPMKNGGWLKIYLNDDSKEENLIIDYGTSPIKISDLSKKLKVGKNTILLVYIDSVSGKPIVPYTKVQFTFSYKSISNPINLDIVKPTNGSLFGRGVDQEINVKLSNFRLTKNDSGDLGVGQMKVFFNSKDQANLVANITSSFEDGENQKVVFSSKDYESNFSKIPDSNNTKLIFVLTDTKGNLLNYEKTVEVKTNYFDSGKIDVASVKIADPVKNSNNTEITLDRVFKLNVNNFTVLEGQKTDEPNQSGIGYIQILVNEQPYRISKNEFSLSSLGLNELTGTVNIKVQLLNKDFTKLNPEASDTITVIIVDKNIEPIKSEDKFTMEQGTWRLVMMSITVLLILAAIVILITRS